VCSGRIFQKKTASVASVPSSDWGVLNVKLYAFVLALLVLTSTLATSGGQTSDKPEIVVVHNGSVILHAMLWRPQGRGPFPAILLNHGSGRSREELERLGRYERNAETLGPVFARHGYVFPVLVQASRWALDGPGL
jgi:hypothetical protein